MCVSQSFQMKASNNYLALRNIEGQYYINGNWRIDFPNDYEAAGTIAHYERIIKGGGSGSGKRIRLLRMFAPEQIRMLGPTTEPLYIVVRKISDLSFLSISKIISAHSKTL